VNTTEEPKLAPPGAGLPKIELLIARLQFAWRRARGDRKSFDAAFRRERERVRGFVGGLDADSAGRRVLIQRVPGLEDSSRYWSAWMTLDHLRIMHSGMVRTIGSLARGVVPSRKASTAAVKPSAEVTAAVVAEFEKSCDELTATVAAVKDLNTSARYAHPWFGPLDAAGWHAFAAAHLQLHRQQIERIVEGLRGRNLPDYVTNQPTKNERKNI
jgi:hypothetical protein